PLKVSSNPNGSMNFWFWCLAAPIRHRLNRWLTRSLRFCLQRYRVVVPYPPQSEAEIELKEGDIVFVHKKREDGWYKGTLQRNGRTELQCSYYWPMQDGSESSRRCARKLLNWDFIFPREKAGGKGGENPS
uniref:SH3 domain-containing protein n=1 Tax=Strix occidentalis caurina TaxID=311401 RepID=A0A8D0G249_STROC